MLHLTLGLEASAVAHCTTAVVGSAPGATCSCCGSFGEEKEIGGDRARTSFRPQRLLVIAAVTFHRRLSTRNTALPLPRDRWFGSLAASTNLTGSEGAGGRAEE